MSFPDEEKTLVARARRIQFFLSQNFTLRNNSLVSQVLMFQLLKLFVALRKSFDGKHDHLPEDAFRGVGSIEDVIAKAEKMGF